jgi:PHD/YefM family antitoxin component YafN of YafNO toxin-antitoxin module
MNLQYITNSNGTTSGVFIPIEDWELIKKELDLKLGIPGWHKEILDERLNQFQAGNAGLKDADSVLKEIESGL